MKTTPIITILLILDTMFLQRWQAGTYRWWRSRLIRVPEGGPLLDHLVDWLRPLGIHMAFMFLLCAALVVVNWRNRLWHPWLPAGITLLWLIMLGSFLDLD